MRCWVGLLLIASCSWGCASTADVEKERETLMGLDREWATTVTDTDKFLSYFAPDASVYVPGAPVATGSGPIRESLTRMSSSPGFALTFAPTRADVSASGDLGYTSGTYESTMGGVMDKGKYITVWQKQSGGEWKVKEDIFNSDAGAPPTAHAMVEAGSIKWGDGPPSLPSGAKIAVIAGDPAKAAPFTIRAQVPAGYKVPPHWHPGDENLTIISGTVALGMGDSFDESKMQSIGAGGYAALPAQMHHYFLAKTASTFQVHGMGPFAVNYVNPADDPSKK
jgi:ketosteroid isomerase-like protein